MTATQTSPGAKTYAHLNGSPRWGTQTDSSHTADEPQSPDAAVALPAADHGRIDTHAWPVGGVLLPPATTRPATLTNLSSSALAGHSVRGLR